MTRETLGGGKIINIFEISSTLVKIEPLTFQPSHSLGVFSPTINRISVSVNGRNHGETKLLILDTHNSKTLLQTTVAPFLSSGCSFSPDGSLFAVSTKGSLIIWKYTSGQYTLWRKFEQDRLPFQFSPNSSSMFAHSGTLLYIFHLDYSPAALSKEAVNTAHTQQLDAFSFFGTYIATAHQNGSIITITNLQPQIPSTSQVIDTGLDILAMVLTGNVLLVKGSGMVVAWLLTEEGLVDGLVDNRRANQNDSLWKRSLHSYSSFFARIIGQEDHTSDDDLTMFAVENEVAAIQHNDYTLCVYHTQTGEILGSDREPNSKGYCLHSPHKGGQTTLYYHDSAHKHPESFEGGWPISQAILQKGWVKDPEGKCRLWIHPDWRSSESDVDWLYNVSTLRLKNPSQSIIIKF